MSTRADLVSGGDVLIEIQVPAAVGADRLFVTVNGRNATTALKPGRQPNTVLGLVKDLPVGKAQLEVSLKGQKTAAQLTVVNHPITGPVISGPHQEPFFCETQAAGLGAPLDPNCTVATKVEYFYRSTAAVAPLRADATPAQQAAANPFKSYPQDGPRPADVAMTTTLDGKRIPYIVRREMGTINRAVYVVAFLHEPGTPLPDPWTTDTSWNGRLVYSFGGGCGVGRHQGTINALSPARAYLEDSQLADYPLSKGYAVATSSLNAFATSCNDVTSAETMMMVKERFIEQYGVPRYTIGTGGSGGSMQQHLIGNNYPGLLDGILPTRSFADTMTFLQPLFDCELLTVAFEASAILANVSWADEQKRAIAGHKRWEYCSQNGRGPFSLLRATSACDRAVPEEQRYHWTGNPRGVRCTYQDNMVNVFGPDPQNGFARRPFDNVGVQYGLTALNSGAITFDQFVALNATVGGFDMHGNPIAERLAGDPEAIRIAYRTGRINHAAGLGRIPIIDTRANVDPTGDIHDAVPTQIVRARLTAANGRADNHVSITTANVGVGARNLAPDSPFSAALRSAFDSMDAWLAAIANDRAPAASAVEKVVRNKPRGLVDACYMEDKQRVTDMVKCRQLFPYSANPRIAAGEPLTADRVKCELKPVDRKDYKQPLTDPQLAMLTSIFKQGVCDYSKKGVGQVPGEPWLSYPAPEGEAAAAARLGGN